MLYIITHSRRWVHKLRCIYTTEYYCEIKTNENTGKCNNMDASQKQQESQRSQSPEWYVLKFKLYNLVDRWNSKNGRRSLCFQKGGCYNKDSDGLFYTLLLMMVPSISTCSKTVKIRDQQFPVCKVNSSNNKYKIIYKVKPCHFGKSAMLDNSFIYHWSKWKKEAPYKGEIPDWHDLAKTLEGPHSCCCVTRRENRCCKQ